MEQGLQPVHSEAFDAVSLQSLQNGLAQCRVLLQKRTPFAFGAHGFLFRTVLMVEGGLQGQFQPVCFVPGLLPCRHVGLQPGVLLFSLLQDAFSQPLFSFCRFLQVLERKEQGGRKRLLLRGRSDGGMCQRGEAFAHVRFVFGQCGGFFLQLFRHPFPFARQPGEIALEGSQSGSGAFQFFLEPRKMFLRPGGGGNGKSGEGVFRGSAQRARFPVMEMPPRFLKSPQARAFGLFGFPFLIFRLQTAVLFFGSEYNGSKRWLKLGPLSFQPSEFAKMAVILFLPWVMEHTKGRSDSLWFMTKAVLCTLPIAALVGSNNLSTAIILLGICAFLIFISHPGYLPFLGIGGAGIGFIAVFLMMESYRLERLAIWRNPEAYEKGFQTIQGLYAIGSGRIFGCGLGKGLQKLGFVPEAQNDMIFSIICEELGLFGAICVILMYILLLWRLLLIATNAKDMFGSYLVIGIMVHIALQVILNIAVVTNSMPNTGVTLPFVSYGGTSIMFLIAEMGVALSVSKSAHVET